MAQMTEKKINMIQPIRNQVLVKPFMADEKSAGGIIVPESFRGESDKVEIINVGNGTNGKPMYLKAGQIAHRVKGWGETIEENGIRYYLMEQESIIALN